MKQYTKWFATALAVTGGLIIASSAQAQYTTNVLSDFNNFNLSATYGQWDADGSQVINGGNGYSPTITSGSLNYTINAEGYGSGAYNLPSPVNASGATMWQLTFTITSPTGGPFWMNPGLDIADGTHLVDLAADPASFPNGGGGTLDYGNFTAGTYTLYGSSFGNLDLSTITAFNLEFDPAGYGSSAPYEITYDNLALLTPVPEPATLALLAVGAVGVVMARRRIKSE